MSRRRTPAVPITLSEQGGVRYLHFGTPWVQGAMRISRPDELVLEYVRRMMGWLLFLAPPQRILQLGLGAGSLTRYCLARCPASAITVVECSDEVIAVGRQCFELPDEQRRLRIVRGDAQEFVERAAERARYGVIQVDLYDMFARGPAIDTPSFYRACRSALGSPGVCVFNLFGEHASYAPNLRRIASAFEGRLLVLPPISEGNRIAFAFQGPALSVGWDRLAQRAGDLRRAYGLHARPWVDALRAQSRASTCEV